MDTGQQIKSIPKNTMISNVRIRPGDKVRLRNGDIEVVTKIYGKGNTINSIHLSNGHNYYEDGQYDAYEDCEHDLDIVKILPKQRSDRILFETETTYGVDQSMPFTKPMESYARLFPVLIHPDGSAFIDDRNLGNPTKITINGKEYAPADSVSPEVHYKSGSFTAVRSTDNGKLLAIWHNEKRFTPADSWPEPITDREPTEEDANEVGDVQVLDGNGDWMRYPWDDILKASLGWARTSDWKPRPIDKKTLILQDLKRAREACIPVSHGALDAAIELLEATL